MSVQVRENAASTPMARRLGREVGPNRPAVEPESLNTVVRPLPFTCAIPPAEGGPPTRLSRRSIGVDAEISRHCSV